MPLTRLRKILARLSGASLSGLGKAANITITGTRIALAMGPPSGSLWGESATGKSLLQGLSLSS